MGFLSKLWKGIKKVAGAVAMIAAPFIAAPIAGAIGISGALGSALTGAAIGGLGAAAAGVNPLVGAALGGLGGFGAARAAGGATGSLFGKGGLFGGAAPGSTASMLGTTGAAGAAGTAATAAGTAAAPAAAAGLTAAAPAAAGGFFSGINIGTLAPVAAALFGKAPQDLTSEELELAKRNMDTSATEKGVFNQRLAGARSLIQAGEANPERAFAEAQMNTQRGLRDVERTAAISGRPGLQTAERRRAAIEGARVGTAAVTGEQARAAQTKAAGLAQLPTDVPTSGAELNMAIYEDLYKRRSDFAKDLAGGFGQMYGNIA
jgi:hypothetical protein